MKDEKGHYSPQCGWVDQVGDGYLTWYEHEDVTEIVSSELKEEEENLALPTQMGEGWTLPGVGSCHRAYFSDGYVVTFLKRGRGEYASHQRAPNMTRPEVRARAREARAKGETLVLV